MSGYIKRGGWVAGSLLGCLMLALPAQGASFDCAKAQTKVEHLICDDPEISKLDDEMDAAYKAALKKEKQANLVRQSQRQWLKIRATIMFADSLTGSYKERIQRLTSGVPFLKESDKYRFEVSDRQEHAENVPVCRDMLASLKKLNKPPMVCGQEFHPSFKQFTYPEWKKLDPREYRDLIMQIVDDVYERNEINYKTESQEIQKSMRKRRQEARVLWNEEVAHGAGSLYIATIPLPKGQTQVLSFAFDKCDGVTPDGEGFPRRYFIVDMEKRRIDFEEMKDEAYFLFHGEGLADHRHSELFLYEGIPHIAFWYQSLRQPDNELFIYSGTKPFTECFIEYNQDGRSNHD